MHCDHIYTTIAFSCTPHSCGPCSFSPLPKVTPFLPLLFSHSTHWVSFSYWLRGVAYIGTWEMIIYRTLDTLPVATPWRQSLKLLQPPSGAWYLYLWGAFGDLPSFPPFLPECCWAWSCVGNHSSGELKRAMAASCPYKSDLPHSVPSPGSFSSILLPPSSQ